MAQSSEAAPEAKVTLEEGLQASDNGNFEYVTFSLSEYLSDSPNGGNDQILARLSDSFIKYLTPSNWDQLHDDLKVFALAIFKKSSILKRLSPIFSRYDMVEFSRLFFLVLSKRIFDDPEQTVQDLLFISSHAAQGAKTFYDWAVPSLYAPISVSASSSNFSAVPPAFAKFVDFDPAATSVPLQECMKSAFLNLATLIRDGSSTFATVRFVNILKFWSQIAMRYPPFSAAFVTICLQAIRADASLKLNPFRINVLRILFDVGAYLSIISPATKILEKSFQTKQKEGSEFDINTLMVAEKDIARTLVYQQFLYSSALELLRKSLTELSAKVAFPEIAAPVIHSIRIIVEEPFFAEKAEELSQFKGDLTKNSLWVQKERERMAEKTGFSIVENTTVEGKSPLRVGHK